MKYLTGISFLVVCLIQWIVPGQMIRNSEDLLDTGKAYKMSITAIYPGQHDSGTYVNIRYQDLQFKVDTNADWVRRQKVYITLKEDESGLCEIEEVFKEKPKGTNDYLKAWIRRIRKEGDWHVLHIYRPGNTYYLDKEQVQAIGPVEHSGLLGRDERRFYATVMVKNGRSLISSVSWE